MNTASSQTLAAPRSSSSSKGVSIAYWIFTGLIALSMTASALGYLTQPMFAQAFAHLGFPQYLRVELGIGKLLGVVALLAPVPARIREWAYAGFGITLISAFIAHTVVDGPAKAAPPLVLFGVLALSYATWTRRTARD